MAVGALLQIIGAVLSIVADKVRRKYIDEYLELKQAWYDEYNRPREQRNNAALDTIKFRIIQLGNTISTDVELAK